MNIFKKLVLSVLSIYPLSKMVEYILTCRRAMVDPNGFGMAALRISFLGIPRQYHHVFYELKEGDICIDGGANLGIFTDLIISRGGICHSFEPNPVLFRNLQRKYKNNPEVHLYQEAISNRNEMVTFKVPETYRRDYVNLSDGGSIENRKSVQELMNMRDVSEMTYNVQANVFTDFLKNLDNIYIYT